MAPAGISRSILDVVVGSPMFIPFGGGDGAALARSRVAVTGPVLSIGRLETGTYGCGMNDGGRSVSPVCGSVSFNRLVRLYRKAIIRTPTATTPPMVAPTAMATTDLRH